MAEIEICPQCCGGVGIAPEDISVDATIGQISTRYEYTGSIVSSSASFTGQAWAKKTNINLGIKKQDNNQVTFFYDGVLQATVTLPDIAQKFVIVVDLDDDGSTAVLKRSNFSFPH